MNETEAWLSDWHARIAELQRSVRAAMQAMARPDGTVPCALDLVTIEAARAPGA